jgi:phosphoribosylamine--glycine ligase
VNVLILGNGGREHALAWKIRQSPLCDQLYVAPGNGGTAQIAHNVKLDITDHEALDNFACENNVSLIVVGPEAPLVAGVADYFAGREDVKVFGPVRDAARLEGSKAFAKAFMHRHGIPTASYREFQRGDLDAALAYVAQHPLPVVVKADGLAAGKGVTICQTTDEAAQAVREALEDDRFGSAGHTLVIEEFLDGVEFSVFALADGKDYVLLPMAKDYKRRFDNHEGPNTGGMGAVSPVPFVGRELRQRVMERIIRPTLDGLRAEGVPYVGFLYFGIMAVGNEPYLLEYNVRMGDPETQVVLPRLQSDLLALLQAAVEGDVRRQDVLISNDPAVTVVVAGESYPSDCPKGLPITGIETAEATGHTVVFHAGTKLSPDRVLVTCGGRVLAVTSFGSTLPDAIVRAQAAAAAVEFDGAAHRSDIGRDVLEIAVIG